MRHGAMRGRLDDPVVRMERIKLVAGGTQLIAVGTVVASIISPMFNPALMPTFWTRFQGAGVATFFELLALWIMGNITPRDPARED